MLKDDTGQEKQTPGISRTDVVDVVKQVILSLKKEEQSEQANDQTAQKVDSMYRQICDSEGNCRLITRQEFARYKAEEKAEREKREKLPSMNAQLRSGMSRSELEDRDRKFARIVEEAGATAVDAHRFVVNDKESRTGLKNGVLKMLEPEEIQDFLTKCFVGSDGQVICSGLEARGFRVQKQEDGKNNWVTVGVGEEKKQEKKKVESHF